MDIGFAGRHPSGHPLQRAIGALTADATLDLRQDGQRWRLHDAQGRLVGRLAASCAPPKGIEDIAARVAAISVRQRLDSEPECLDRSRRDRWEVVLPELAFAPACPQG